MKDGGYMATLNLSRAEQETIINFAADMKTAEIYTCDPVMMRRMEKLVAERPDVFTKTEQDEVSATYSCPKRCVRISAPRIVSDEQREAARQRFAEVRARKEI